MSDLARTSSPIALPAARVAIRIRKGVLGDLPFMDALQKKTTKAVGFMPTGQLQGKIEAGHVLVAEHVEGGTWQVGGENPTSEGFNAEPQATIHEPQAKRVGYLIGNENYFKRDEVGIIYQINVAPEFRRSLVAANLLRAQFEKSSYACRLYCCWCAQDLDANRFWESMGFVPLAFRAGSEKKSRVHIFWQKRIKGGDASTPWWFPSQTSGGSMGDDRIVLPIPQGMHWSDEMPRVLPGMKFDDVQLTGPELKLVGVGETVETNQTEAGPSFEPAEKPRKRRAKLKVEPVVEIPVRRRGSARVSLVSAGPSFAVPVPVVEEVEEKVTEKPARVKPPRKKKKNDPRFVEAARTVRARWQEEMAAGNLSVEAAGKYELAQDAPAMLDVDETRRVAA